MSIAKPSLRSSGDRDVLVNQWIHLPKWVVKKYKNSRAVRTLGFDDALGYGHIGLIRAAELFDDSRGFCFSTYAARSIWNHIIRAFFDFGFTIRIPQHRWNRGDHPPKVHTSSGLVSRLENQLKREDYWDKLEEDSSYLGSELGYLRRRTRDVLKMIYKEGKTLQETGKVIGVTKERVRQIRNQGLEELRERMV